MSSRFTSFWKQIIPPSLSSIDSPFERASYRSLFLADSICKKPTCSEDLAETTTTSDRTRTKGLSIDPRCFEDVAG
jgi:hypothetical protein